MNKDPRFGAHPRLRKFLIERDSKNNSGPGKNKNEPGYKKRYTIDRPEDHKNDKHTDL